MIRPELQITPADNDEIRAVKQLLLYGAHRPDCDLACDKPSISCPATAHPDGLRCEGCDSFQHECCSCEWCEVEDWAWLELDLRDPDPGVDNT